MSLAQCRSEITMNVAGTTFLRDKPSLENVSVQKIWPAPKAISQMDGNAEGWTKCKHREDLKDLLTVRG